MFLKKLEIQGFKSFAGKTELHFPARIVGIVGPNGSGKSNIIDAVRWILGERAAKNLRGESLGNLIFAGTPKRPAASLARVALHMTRGKLLPAETEEVVLERKIDKSGASQFFINSAEVRLKDLAPMLARARLGTRGLTIISQGQSDVFVKSSPAQRRLMIEEILGLKEFRIKKSDAERKLQSTGANMERVSAQAEEIEPHLRFLKKQKGRWQKREELEQELNTLAGAHFGLEMKRAKEKIKLSEAKTVPLKKKKQEKEAKIQKLKNVLDTLETGVRPPEKSTKEDKLGALLQKKSELEREIIKIETTLEIEQKRGEDEDIEVAELIAYAKALKSELEKAAEINDLETLKTRVKKWISELQKVFRRKESPEKTPLSTDELKKHLQATNAEITKLREEEREKAKAQEGANKVFRTLLDAIERERTAVHGLEKQITEAELEQEKIRIKKEELENQWRSLGKTMAELEQVSEDPPAGETGPGEQKIAKLQAELASIGEIDKELLEEADETERRHAFLTKELADLEKASEDLAKMIKELDTQIHSEFTGSFKKINEAFNSYFGIMFGGGKGKLTLEKPTTPENSDETEVETSLSADEADLSVAQAGLSAAQAGVEFELSIPRKKIKSLDMLSGGEKSLVSLAALFSLISISPPPFLMLDEIDAALDDENARRFAELVTKFSKNTQFIIVTHNRITMEHADILYGITMGDEGASKILSLKLEQAEEMANA